MIQECICKIIQSSSILELANGVEGFLEHIALSNNKRHEISQLVGRVMIEAFYLEAVSESGYRLYDAKNSVLKYLANYLQIDQSTEKSIASLKEIATWIQVSYGQKERALISNEKIEMLFKLVDEKYNFTNLILAEQKVDILQIDCTHKMWNAYYSVTVIPKQQLVYDSIILPSQPFDSVISQEFYFLHELGHLFHTRITKEIEMVPEAFYVLVRYILPKEMYLSEKTKAETFADCFASATLYGTLYDNAEIEKSVKMAWEEYMRALIQRYFLPRKEASV
jgi:hypothetical protein